MTNKKLRAYNARVLRKEFPALTWAESHLLGRATTQNTASEKARRVFSEKVLPHLAVRRDYHLHCTCGVCHEEQELSFPQVDDLRGEAAWGFRNLYLQS